MLVDSKQITVLDAPSNLGLAPPAAGRLPGVYKLPAAMRAAGLLASLGALDGGQVTPPAYDPVRDPATGVRNFHAIPPYSRALAERIQGLLSAGQFPLVLGGDCSILIGAGLALNRLGRYGLLYIDGHTDFGTPETSGTGGAAGMDLALATGLGPEPLSNIDGRRPLVRASDVVVFGIRDIETPEDYAWRAVFDTGVTLIGREDIRQEGIAAAVERALAVFRRQAVDGVWLHVDADVLDEEVMPAVDSPMPDGLSSAELREVLNRVLASGLAVGMELTIFDPDLDPTGAMAREFTGMVVDAFERVGQEE